MKILITGAAGYIGRAVFAKLSTIRRHDVIGSTRSVGLFQKTPKPLIPVGEISSNTNWSMALQDVDIVIHLAARAHILKCCDADPLSEFRKVNVDGALALAEQAVAAGVKRFIFISSIGVNGSHTNSAPFSESTPPAPHADYALSKLEAEQGLCSIAQESTMELVIIRPPLVYSGDAPGNFHRLLQLVSAGIPLPFAAVKNNRSMIALENLVEFIALCVEHPAAANELFLISDGIDVSMPKIIHHVAEGMGRRARLLHVPDMLMRFGATLLGKKAMHNQLCDSLVIDSSKARDLLGWTPLVTPEQALFKAGQDYRQLLASHS